MADAAAVDENTPAAAPAPAFPIKLLIIVSVVALVFGIGGAFVALKFLGGTSKGTESAEEQKADAELAADADANNSDGDK